MESGNRPYKRVVLVAILLAVLFCLSACQESTSAKYERANKLLADGKYTEASTVFDEISTYEDSSKMSMYTKAINAAENGDFDTAVASFKALGDFKDCSMMIAYYSGRQAESSVYDGARINGSKWFEAIKTYESIPLFKDSKERAEACRKDAYEQAVRIGDDGNTDFAISIMKELGSYSDSAKQRIYYEAKTLYNKGKYREASEKYSMVTGFRDADELTVVVLKDGYNAAVALEEAGKTDEAHEAFLALGDYEDATTRAYKLYYDAGTRMREAQNWDGARAAFLKAGAYNDAAMQIKETTYQEASALEASGDQESAYQLFSSLGEYSDSFERANKPYYDLGIELREAEDWSGAVAAFKHAGTYSDASIQIIETTYQEACSLETAGDQEGAYRLFISLGKYSDSFERANKPYYDLGVEKRKNRDWDGAIAAFIQAGDYNDATEQILKTYYDEGVDKQGLKDWEGAREAFINAGDYGDAALQISETSFLEALLCFENEEFDKALSIFQSLTGYKDADRKVSECIYALAEEYEKSCYFKKAGDLYESITDYEDAAKKARLMKEKCKALDLFLIRDGDLYGYCSQYGEVILECEWQRTDGFSYGLARVCNSYGEYAVIDKQGNIIVDYSNRLVSIENGYIVSLKGLYDYIVYDNRGKKIWQSESAKSVKIGEDIISYVSDEGNVFFYDIKNAKTYKYSYDDSPVWSCGEFSDGWCRIQNTCMIGRDFASRLPLSEPIGVNHDHSFCDGMLMVKNYDTGRYGYVDVTGRLIVQCEWDEYYSGEFSEGYAYVQKSKNTKGGYIGKDGKMLTGFIFDDGHEFSEGMACVIVDNKIGYINRAGKMVISPQFSYATRQFADGMNEAIYGYNFTNGLALVKKDGDSFYINKKGEKVFPYNYSDFTTVEKE